MPTYRPQKDGQLGWLNSLWRRVPTDWTQTASLSASRFIDLHFDHFSTLICIEIDYMVKTIF